MRYMLLIYKDESVYDQLPPEERGAIFQEAIDSRRWVRRGTTGHPGGGDAQ